PPGSKASREPCLGFLGSYSTKEAPGGRRPACGSFLEALSCAEYSTSAVQNAPPQGSLVRRRLSSMDATTCTLQDEETMDRIFELRHPEYPAPAPPADSGTDGSLPPASPLPPTRAARPARSRGAFSGGG